MIILIIIILFYFLTPGVLIKIKGNKYFISLIHAIIFSGILIMLYSIGIIENMKNMDISGQSMDISGQSIDIIQSMDISGQSIDIIQSMDTSNQKYTRCPEHSVHLNGNVDASCVECPFINGRQLGVVGMHDICAVSNNIYEKGFVETIENGKKCSNIFDSPISIRGDNKQYCISNEIVKNSSGTENFNKVITPSNMIYYQTT
jgi:hypothetical protein